MANNYKKNNMNYNNSYNQPKQEIRKHSGAKLTKYFPQTGNNAGQEQYLVTGWKLNRRRRHR